MTWNDLGDMTRGYRSQYFDNISSVKSTSNPMFESVLNVFCSKEAHFIFLPLTYNGEVTQIDLTLGHRYRNSEIYIL